MERVGTGVPNLDIMLGGGLTRGDVMIVRGGPGAGKTAFALQWICKGAAELGEPGAIVVLEETPQQFYQRTQALGWDLKGLEEQNKVRTIFTSAEALSNDILTGSLLVGMLAEINARRVAIDPISHYRLIYQDERHLRQQVQATINALKRLGQTSLLTAEVGTAGYPDPAPEEYLADSVLSLHEVRVKGKPFRQLEVLKLNASDSRPRSGFFRITHAGIELLIPPIAALRRPLEAPPLGVPCLQGAADGSFNVFELESDLRRATIDLLLMAAARRSGRSVVYIANSSVGPRELWERIVSLEGGESPSGVNSSLDVVLLEPFGRKQPPGLPASRFTDFSWQDGNEVVSLVQSSEASEGTYLQPKQKTLMVFDLCDVFFHIGSTRFRLLLPQLLDIARRQQMTIAGVMDPRLLPADCRYWVRGVADSITRIWEEAGARFLRVDKGAAGKWSEPHLVVETPDPPFLELFD